MGRQLQREPLIQSSVGGDEPGQPAAPLGWPQRNYLAFHAFAQVPQRKPLAARISFFHRAADLTQAVAQLHQPPRRGGRVSRIARVGAHVDAQHWRAWPPHREVPDQIHRQGHRYS